MQYQRQCMVQATERHEDPDDRSAQWLVPLFVSRSLISFPPKKEHPPFPPKLGKSSVNRYRSKRYFNRLGDPARRQRHRDQHLQQTPRLLHRLDDGLAERCRHVRVQWAEYHAELWGLCWERGR